MKALFHLAYHVTDLDETRAFYGGVLGCREGRSTATWVDFDFFGHQISLHLGTPFETAKTGQVAGQLVPMPHLGIVLPMADWDALAAKIRAAGIAFEMEPHIRNTGQPGEQGTMFLRDPSGNPIEIKGVADWDEVFAT